MCTLSFNIQEQQIQKDDHCDFSGIVSEAK